MKDSENRYGGPFDGKEGFRDFDGTEAEAAGEPDWKESSEAAFSGGDVTGSGDQAYDPEQRSADPGIDPELSVEEAFDQLELLIKRMETDGISLEESFACYEKGIRLVRYCNDRIDRVEKKVRILRGEGGISGEDRM